MAGEIIEIEIDHRVYKVRVGEHGAARIEKLAAYVDERIREFRKLAPNLEASRLYVLCLMNLADELQRREADGAAGDYLVRLRDLLSGEPPSEDGSRTDDSSSSP